MRIIWTITGLVVAVTLTILGYREYRKATQAEAVRDIPPVSAASEYDKMVSAMFAKLENDHQARHPDTQRSVEAVAALAESGARETADTYYALGVRLHGERKLAAAEAAFRKAIALDPEWSWPHNGLGVVLFERKREDEARAAFAKASELDPDWSRPHSDLSILLRLSNRLEEAEKEAAKAVELAPNRLDALTAYANVLKARGKMDEAEEYYRRSVEADPRHPTPYYNLACFYSLRKEPEKALEKLEQAFSIDPSFADFAQRDPDLSDLHNDPRFEELAKAANKAKP
ncbi:MAG: tetratricopeptide repeat protein [FCB group bacterium]|jgi:Flp pilus assembly protein TadD|nr:tetratricopeptide repeat protein [FCB group bacterium]